MTIALIIISILLIALVLLQGGAEDGANIISGGNSDLFTFVLGVAFMIICAILK